MSRSLPGGTRGIALLLVIVVLLGTVPTLASAETRSGGSVVVEDDETVADLTSFGGTIVVRGTVEGDLTAVGGNIVIERDAEVTGSVEATGGNIRIAGTVGGDVSATGGNVFVTRTATVAGRLEAAAGRIDVAGQVGGDAMLAGGSVTLASTATIDGDVEYDTGEDGAFTDEGATVRGSVTRNEKLSGTDEGVEFPAVSGPVFGVYGFLVNVVVGALLLLVLPRTTERIADRVKNAPLRTGGIGLGALIGVPIGLALVAITIVGLPVTLAGLVAYGLAVWIATVYGRYAVGAVIVSYTDVESRWVALFVGLVVVAVLVRIPVLGGVIEFVVLLLGLGAIADRLYRFVRGQYGPEPPAATEEATPV